MTEANVAYIRFILLPCEGTTPLKRRFFLFLNFDLEISSLASHCNLDLDKVIQRYTRDNLYENVNMLIIVHNLSTWRRPQTLSD